MKKLQKKKQYKNISPDKPLTPKERVFCLEYIKSKNGTQAAIKAGYSQKTAHVLGNRLVYLKPNTKKYIGEVLSRYFDRLEFDAFDVLQRIGHIAMCDASELTAIRNGRVIVPETDTLPRDALALFAGARERINERGDITVEVKQHDQLAALKLLCQYYGILDKTRGAKQEPLIEQKKAIQSVLDGSKPPIDAALELELQGIPLPETLRILVSKYAEPEDDPDDGDSVIPTPEEMDQRRKKRLKEIEDQKENFLPKRQKEVRDMKAEMGKKNQEFSGDTDGEKKD
jgi:phage terminase small subunit